MKTYKVGDKFIMEVKWAAIDVYQMSDGACVDEDWLEKLERYVEKPTIEACPYCGAKCKTVEDHGSYVECTECNYQSRMYNPSNIAIHYHNKFCRMSK